MQSETISGGLEQPTDRRATDGITEARNHAGELFGEERLAQTLASVRSSAVTPDLLIDAIGTAVADFRGEECDNSDDCASLIITAT